MCAALMTLVVQLAGQNLCCLVSERAESGLGCCAGYKIPKGMGIRTAFYAMQRDEEIWDQPVRLPHMCRAWQLSSASGPCEHRARHVRCFCSAKPAFYAMQCNEEIWDRPVRPTPPHADAAEHCTRACMLCTGPAGHSRTASLTPASKFSSTPILCCSATAITGQ